MFFSKLVIKIATQELGNYKFMIRKKKDTFKYSTAAAKL